MKPHTSSAIRGPAAVERNLIDGLSRLGVGFRMNPPDSAVTSRVGVLRHLGALQWAIKARQDDRIRFLAAGPNLVVTPREAGGILCSPEIDLVITPSRWVSEVYLALAPELAGRIREWVVGVDTDYWKPGEVFHTRDFAGHWLIYDKTGGNFGVEELNNVREEIKGRKQSYETIEYGEYTLSGYLNALRRSGAMIVLSPSESQGIAQFEAWSCNVPTLVWDRRQWDYKGHVFQGQPVSSSPYLDAQCGERFFSSADLPTIMDKFLERYGEYSPRDFILQSHTITKSAQKYVDLMSV